MQNFLPIALRVAKDIDVIDVIYALSDLFQELCEKELSIEKLGEIGANVAITLCKIEKMFPPNFFTIIVNLVVYLIEESKLEGPVFYRWMYPIERSKCACFYLNY